MEEWGEACQRAKKITRGTHYLRWDSLGNIKCEKKKEGGRFKPVGPNGKLSVNRLHAYIQFMGQCTGGRV